MGSEMCIRDRPFLTIMSDDLLFQDHCSSASAVEVRHVGKNDSLGFVLLKIPRVTISPSSADPFRPEREWLRRR